MKKHTKFPAWLKQCAAAGIALALSVSFPASAAASGEQEGNGWYSQKVHAGVDYSQMLYEPFNPTVLEAALDDLRAACRQPNQEALVTTLYHTILEEADWMNTLNSLHNILYYKNPTEERAQEEERIALQYTQLTDRIFTTLKQTAESSYRPVLEELAGIELTETLLAYTEMAPEEFDLTARELSLTQEYDQLMSEGVTVIVNGKEWTSQEFQTSPPDNPRTYDKVNLALTKELNLAAGEIFLNLIRLRTEIAQINGYSNYSEFAYSAMYNRDFSPKESAKLYSEVKKRIVPLKDSIARLFLSSDYELLDSYNASTGEEILDAIAPSVARIAPELDVSFQYLRENHLYDIEAEDSKLTTGFTIGLPSYGDAFIFDSPYGTYEDYSTMFHEFGHFNALFYGDEPSLFSLAALDVSEIQSQALELLALRYADDIFEGGGDSYRLYTLYQMLDSIIHGCCFDEFQNEVYSHPDMSLEEVNRTFYDIQKSYGLSSVEEGRQSYSWIYVSHNFRAPLYYISYSTSALSALDIWLKSNEDWTKAVNQYLQISAMDSFTPYKTALKESGLRNIFVSGTVTDMAEEIRTVLDIEQSFFLFPSSPSGPLWMFGGAFAILLISIAWVIRWRRQP